MKFCLFLSSTFYVLFTLLPFSIFAVECPSSDLPYFEIECPACVVYSCGEKIGAGCPDDFFRDCSTFKSAIEFIDNKNYLYLNYFDGLVSYVAGCEQELDGQPCIQDKAEQFAKKIKNYKDGILWNGSNSQNGSALKLIGIIAFGWIFAY